MNHFSLFVVCKILILAVDMTGMAELTGKCLSLVQKIAKKTVISNSFSKKPFPLMWGA